jgi:L-amino acid N-acyltransferase YncA
MNTIDISIRTMNNEEWPSVAAIYKEGIKTGNATFQQEVPTWDSGN